MTRLLTLALLLTSVAAEKVVRFPMKKLSAKDFRSQRVASAAARSLKLKYGDTCPTLTTTSTVTRTFSPPSGAGQCP